MITLIIIVSIEQAYHLVMIVLEKRWYQHYSDMLAHHITVLNCLQTSIKQIAKEKNVKICESLSCTQIFYM